MRNRGRAVLVALFLVLALGIVTVTDLSITWFGHGPRIKALVDSTPPGTAYMALRAREGRPPILRRWTPLDSLPVAVVCAVLAAENVRFFQHGTLDYANQREMLSRVLRGDPSRGGSGIAQQLARNLYLEPDRTIRRKLREYVLAYKISHTLTKERQLELYLNLVEWGDGVWGVAAGGESLFQRSLDQLTPSEVVLLANVPPAPARGLEFATARARRAKSVIVTGILWREGILDELQWTATVARLRRIGDFVDQGMTPARAAEAAADEMGEEEVLADTGPTRQPVRDRCNPANRGIT